MATSPSPSPPPSPTLPPPSAVADRRFRHGRVPPPLPFRRRGDLRSSTSSSAAASSELLPRPPPSSFFFSALSSSPSSVAATRPPETPPPPLLSLSSPVFVDAVDRRQESADVSLFSLHGCRSLLLRRCRHSFANVAAASPPSTVADVAAVAELPFAAVEIHDHRRAPASPPDLAVHGPSSPHLASHLFPRSSLSSTVDPPTPPPPSTTSTTIPAPTSSVFLHPPPLPPSTSLASPFSAAALRHR